MDLWSIAVVIAVSAGSGVLSAVIFALVGGLGGIWSVQRQVRQAETRIADLDERLTRDQKRRAGQARQDTTTDADLKRQAAEVLSGADQPAQARGDRPSVINLRR